jgi:hypothetical protein
MPIDDDIHLLFDVLSRELTPTDWRELRDRCFSPDLDEVLWEFEYLWRRYPPDDGPWRYPELLHWALHRLQRRGQLGRFVAVVCEIRPDLEGLLRGYERPPLPMAPPPPAMAPRPPAMAPPPPLAAPPPIILRRWWLYALLLIGVIAGASLLLFWWRGSAGLLFASQIVLLTVAVCLTPTIAHHLTKRWGRVARVVLETTLFTALLLGFGVWLFGVAVVGVWIIYTIVLILILEAGSHLIERYKVITLNRLSRSVAFKNLQSDAEAVERMFHNELTLYIPVPLGLIVGTIVGLIRNQRPQEIIVFCLQLVLLLVSLVLIYFLLVAFSRLSDSMFRTSHVPSPRVSEEKRDGLLGHIGKVFRLLVPRPKSEKEDQEQNDLDLACMVTDLRKVYLYDAMHNVILLVAFIAVALSLWNIVIDTKWLISSLIALGLVVNQLPFVIGQSALHEKVLERYEGLKRSEMAEKLKKHAPLFPTLDFLAALFTTGTAGGVLYFLLDQFMKEALK